MEVLMLLRSNNPNKTEERPPPLEASEGLLAQDGHSGEATLPADPARKQLAGESCRPAGGLAEEGSLPEQPTTATESKTVGAKEDSTVIIIPASTRFTTAHPIIIDPTDFAPFPLDALPMAIRAYVLAVAKNIGCDPAMVAGAILVALASAIGNSRRIQVRDNWGEPSILWLAVVGDSGSQKSPAQDAAVRFLRDIDSRAHVDFLEAQQEFEEKLEQYEQAQRKRGGSSASPSKPKPPRMIQQLIDDITMEALPGLLQPPSRGLLVDADELSAWFGSFNSYRGGHGRDVPNWLKVHGGRAVTVNRKGSPPVRVEYPAVSIVGGIQPEILRKAFTAEHFANGLAARFLLVYPPKQRRTWSDRKIDPALTANVQFIFEVLRQLEGETRDGRIIPREVPLTPDARALLIEFTNRHLGELYVLQGKEAALWSKLEATASRLALIIHLTREAAGELPPDAPNAIDDVSMAAGIRLAEWFGREGLRVYKMQGGLSAEGELLQLVSYIRRCGGSIRLRDLQRGNRAFKTPGRAEEALNDLVGRGWGRWEFEPAGPKGGSPTRRFVLREFDHPAVDVTPANPEADGGSVDVDSGSESPTAGADEGGWPVHSQN
jgi:hypothetical protein